MNDSTSQPVTVTSSLPARSTAISAAQLGVLLHWMFRVALLMEFVGHGAFGIMTKASWVPYFGVFGISEPMAYRLMPIIGTVDISLATLAFLSPRRAALAYMTFWGFFTAMLRPLSGESFWEVLDRAGNYGIPLAFLLYSGWAHSAREWFAPIRPRPMTRESLRGLTAALKWTTVLCLFGHGAYGALLQKPVLTKQYAAMGLTSLPWVGLEFTRALGWIEIALGLAIAIRPFWYLLIVATGYKVATELLYPMTGAPIWEFVERGGTYIAPLALFAILQVARPPRGARKEPTERTE